MLRAQAISPDSIDSRVAACPDCKIRTSTHAVRYAQAAFGVLPSSVDEPVSVSMHTPDGRQVCS